MTLKIINKIYLFKFVYDMSLHIPYHYYAPEDDKGFTWVSKEGKARKE